MTALIVQHECNEYAGKLPWYRRLLETFEQRAQQQVRRWIDEVHLQLETWQATVQSSTVGQALFDSFGQVLALNEPLQEMLEEERPLTLLEVLGQVTAVESERLQESLRDLIFERRPQSFWVHGLGSEARQITLRPIIARRSADRHPFVIPFDVQAVFLEVLDGRAIEERVKARESAARSTLDVADELLADVESIACDLDVESMLLHAPDHALDRGPDFLPRTLRQVRGALEQSREFLARPITDRVDDRVPVDMAAILQESIDRVRQSDRGALVCWQVRLPDRMPPVHANPHRLKILLDELWAILIGDPMADAQAAVVGRAGVDSVTVRIQVSGFANSLGQLIDVLPADQPGALAGFRRMDDLQQWVRVWNGRLEVDSQAGQVLIVTLQLPAFQVALSASESVRG